MTIKQGLRYYWGVGETNVELRKRIEKEWFILTETIFFCWLILTMTFMITNLQQTKFFYYLYLGFLILFLVISTLFLTITIRTTELIRKK